MSNLYLEDFDKSLSDSKFSAVRYADDLAIFCNSKDDCLEAHEFCVDNLKKLKLQIQPLSTDPKSKTKIYKPDEEAEFLGLGLVKIDDGYELIITDSQIDKVWKKFKEFTNVESNVISNIKFASLHHRLESIIDSYKGHYGEAYNYEVFEANLKIWKRKVYLSIFRDSYKVNLEDLSYKQKQFIYLLD